MLLIAVLSFNALEILVDDLNLPDLGDEFWCKVFLVLSGDSLALLELDWKVHIVLGMLSIVLQLSHFLRVLFELLNGDLLPTVSIFL